MKKTIALIFLIIGFFSLSQNTTHAAENTDPPSEVIRLVFIGASTFGDWMGNTERGGASFAGDLLTNLNQNNYFVSNIGASTTYFNSGVEVNGDYSPITNNNIGNFFTLFRGVLSVSTYLPELYSMSNLSMTDLENIQNGSSISDPGGENEIVLFKANHRSGKLLGNPSDSASDISTNSMRGVIQADNPSVYTVANAKSIYLDLLNYFAANQDKLFVAITSPSFNVNGPGYDVTEAANTRAFANWLVNDWLTDYEYDNVAVFDFFNIMTHVDNHHRVNSVTGEIEHTIDPESPNYTDPSYAYLTDIHPLAAGHQKATAEFTPLLNAYYNTWQGITSVTPTPTPTLTATPTPTPQVAGTQNSGSSSSGSTTSQVSLPEAGFIAPTLVLVISGILLILASPLVVVLTKK